MNKIRINIFTFILLIFCTTLSVADENMNINEKNLTKSTTTNTNSPRFTPYTGIITNFNLQDFLVGFDVGIYDRALNWSATISYDWRVIDTWVLIPKKNTDKTFYQVNERLRRFTLNAYKDFPIAHFSSVKLGPSFGLSGSLIWESYNGFSESNVYLKAIPNIGLCIHIKENIVAKVGYQYWNTGAFNIDNNRVFIHFHAKVF